MQPLELEVIILAAGKGTRMRSSLPKVLHQVAGTAMLGHVLNAVAPLKPSKVHVVVGHGKGEVMAKFSEHDINWVEQTEQLGTGHAVLQAMPSVADGSAVLMLTADVPLIATTTLKAMIEQTLAFPLALLTALFDDPTGLGRIVRNGDSVIGIVEEKDCSDEQRHIKEINSGMMCARAGDLNNWLKQLSNNNAQGEYYLTDIVGLAHQEGNPIAALHPANNHEVEGVNSRVQLAQVERIYQHQRAYQLMNDGVTIVDPARLDIRGEVYIEPDTVLDVNTVIHGPTHIGSHVYIAPNCTISASEIGDNSTVHANSVIENAILGQHVNVGPFARLRPGTELGNEVRIGNFVETKNAKLATGSKANHLSYVGDSTVGERTNIGAGVITCNYDGANKHQTTIGNNAFIGSNSQLVAPVTVGEGATIAAGSTITNDVEADCLAVARAKQRQIKGWKRPTKKN